MVFLQNAKIFQNFSGNKKIGDEQYEAKIEGNTKEFELSDSQIIL